MGLQFGRLRLKIFVASPPQVQSAVEKLKAAHRAAFPVGRRHRRADHPPPVQALRRAAGRRQRRRRHRAQVRGSGRPHAVSIPMFQPTCFCWYCRPGFEQAAWYELWSRYSRLTITVRLR